MNPISNQFVVGRISVDVYNLYTSWHNVIRVNYYFSQDFISKGYGVRDLDTQEPVTNETLFVINSVTKNFAGVTMAIVLRDHEKSVKTFYI